MDRIQLIADFWQALAALSNRLRDTGIAIIPDSCSGGAVIHSRITINSVWHEYENRREILQEKKRAPFQEKVVKLTLDSDQEEEAIAKAEIPWGDLDPDIGFDHICLHLLLTRNGKYLMNECPEYAQAGAIWESLGGYWGGGNPNDSFPADFWWELTHHELRIPQDRP